MKRGPQKPSIATVKKDMGKEVGQFRDDAQQAGKALTKQEGPKTFVGMLHNNVSDVIEFLA